MTNLDSLITPANLAHLKALPDDTATALYSVLMSEWEAGTRVTRDAGTLSGLRKVGLPSEESVTPALCTAAAILATWQDSDDTPLSDRIMIAAFRARSLCMAAIQRDRETSDSRLRSTFDPTDTSSDVIYEAERQSWQGTQIMDGTDTLAACSSSRPDAVTSMTVSGLTRCALAIANDTLGFDHWTALAVMHPEFGERVREGDGPVLRAMGAPTSGRGRKAAQDRVHATKAVLRHSGILACRRVETNLRKRAAWSEADATLAASLVTTPRRYADPTNIHPVFLAYNGKLPAPAWANRPVLGGEVESVKGTVSGDVTRKGPATSEAGRMAGVRQVSRRAGKGGQTGPTVPAAWSDRISATM